MVPVGGMVGGCMVPVGGMVGGCLVWEGRCLVRGGPGGNPPEMATAAGGTQSTGMHSCCSNCFYSNQLIIHTICQVHFINKNAFQ